MPPIKLEEGNQSLLVLPPLPSPLTRASLWSAYKITFEELLPKTVPRDSKYVSRLDIAISLPSNRKRTSRTAHYPQDQLIFQEVYTLACLAAARTNIELDFPGGIDIRIFLIENDSSSSDSRQWLAGPVISTTTLASARTYTTIYSVDGEQGESSLQLLLQAYRNRRKTTPTVQRLPSGPSMINPSTSASTTDQLVQTHRHVINGGTFDHLHLGHKLLLTATVYLSDPAPEHNNTDDRISRSITIGTTGDELLVNKKHPEQLESWDTRQRRTHEFIDSILAFHPTQAEELEIRHEHINNPGPNGKTVRVTYTLKPKDRAEEQVIVNYTQISDPYGPTITVENLSALIISAETRAGGKAVNDKRKEKGWKELEVFEVGVLDAKVDEDDIEISEKEGFDGKLSSTGMRKRLAELTGETNSKNGGGKL